MATYNGEKYINQQIRSILTQLDNCDELIISDDSSTDNTVKVIKEFDDTRIKLYKNKTFKSPIFNFENSIKHATGDIIVLSDQDDLWDENKLEVIRSSFINESMSLKMYNGNCIDKNDVVIKEDLFEYIGIRDGLLQNIKKNSFIGCNIAFTRDLLAVTLPFPVDTPMHDMWLGSCAYMVGKVEFVDKKIFSYRLHDNNFTNRKISFSQKIKWRYQLIKNLLIRRIQIAIS